MEINPIFMKWLIEGWLYFEQLKGAARAVRGSLSHTLVVGGPHPQTQNRDTFGALRMLHKL